MRLSQGWDEDSLFPCPLHRPSRRTTREGRCPNQHLEQPLHLALRSRPTMSMTGCPPQMQPEGPASGS